MASRPHAGRPRRNGLAGRKNPRTNPEAKQPRLIPSLGVLGLNSRVGPQFSYLPDPNYDGSWLVVVAKIGGEETVARGHRLNAAQKLPSEVYRFSLCIVLLGSFYLLGRAFFACPKPQLQTTHPLRLNAQRYGGLPCLLRDRPLISSSSSAVDRFKSGGGLSSRFCCGTPHHVGSSLRVYVFTSRRASPGA